jgi:hypothetical protein
MSASERSTDSPRISGSFPAGQKLAQFLRENSSIPRNNFSK